MRTGDFSATQLAQYLGPYYQPISTGAQCNNSYGNVCAVPQTGPGGQTLVNGNIAPYLDPMMSLVVGNMPLPNIAAANRTGPDNYITTNLVNNNLWQAKTRVDYALSDRNKFFATYGIERGLQYEPNGIYSYIPQVPFGDVNAPGGGQVSPLVSHVASMNFTTIASPTLTNEFYAAGAFFSQRFKSRNPAANSKASAVAASGNQYQGLFNNGSQAIVNVGDYGYDNLPFNFAFDQTFGGYYTNKQIRTAGDNVTKLLGQHTLRAGIYYQWDSNPQSQQQNTNGSVYNYYMPGNFTDPYGNTVYGTNGLTNGIGGNYTADQLEGQFFGYTQASFQALLNIYFWNLSGYIQDHWRATPHLSFDLGVRLEHFTPWIDAHGVGIAVFDKSDYAVTFAAGNAGTSGHQPGILYHKADPSVPLGGVSFQPVWPEPRAGFAWDVFHNGKITLRGGAGIYHQHDSYNDVQNPLYTAVGQINYNFCCFGTLATISGLQSTATGSASTFAKDQSVYALLKGDNQQPAIYTYNLAWDHQVTRQVIFEIAYAGNRSLHILNTFGPNNINALPVGTLFKAQPNSGRTDTASTVGTVFPFFAPPNSNSNTSIQNLTQAVTDSFKPYALYNDVYAQAHTAYASYNALQTQITVQGHYGRLNMNYTWSKALGATAGGDPTNIRNDYNLENFSRANIYNATYSIQSGNHVRNRALGYAANGWELSGYVGLQSGPNLPSVYGNNFGLGGTLTLPINSVAYLPGQAPSTCSSNPCTVGVGSTTFLGTPDVNLQPTIIAQPRGTKTHQYAIANAFGLPQLGSNGTFHFGYLPGPAFFDTDITATRNFRLENHGTLGLRLAAFNFINHPNVSFSGLDPTAYQLNYTQTVTGASVNSAVANAVNDNTNFGTANFAAGRRIVELSLRYNF